MPQRFNPIRFYAETACLAAALLVCLVSPQESQPPSRLAPMVDYMRDRGEDAETVGVPCSKASASAAARNRTHAPASSNVSS